MATGISGKSESCADLGVYGLSICCFVPEQQHASDTVREKPGDFHKVAADLDAEISNSKACRRKNE